MQEITIKVSSLIWVGTGLTLGNFLYALIWTLRKKGKGLPIEKISDKWWSAFENSAFMIFALCYVYFGAVHFGW